jgi:hypothetical protein
MDTKLIIKENRSHDKIFLNEKYDSAILWINHTTGSVIYSLTMLIQIDIEDMGREGLLEYMPEGQSLIQFLSNNFLQFFEILQKSAKGIPPSLHYDVNDRLGLAAA